MVLFQVTLIDNAGGVRANKSTPCPFYGKYKVKLLNYHCRVFSPTQLTLRVDCQEFTGGVAYVTGRSGFANPGLITNYGSPIFVANYSQSGVHRSFDGYEFEANMDGMLNFTVSDIKTGYENGVIPALTAYNIYFSFDFEKI